MKLMTKELRRKLPPLYATEDKTEEETIVQGKLFNPCGPQMWWLIEAGTGEDEDTLFCYVTGMGEDELGYASLSELESLRFRMVVSEGRIHYEVVRPGGPAPRVAIGIERDRYFEPLSLAKVKSMLAEGKMP